VRSRVPLLLLALLPVLMGAHAQSSRDQRGAPDTRIRGYWVDPSTGLMWADRDSFGRDLNWRQATKYCTDLQLAAHADWRLPTIVELEGIYDRSANAPGLGGKRNDTPQTYHVRGDLFLTGKAWSADRRIDDRGRPSGYALLFDFVNGRRGDGELWFHTGDGALCVRGDVTVDLSLPALSRHEAARQVGVDYTAPRYFDFDNGAARREYWQSRFGCEDAVVSRVPWLSAERNCRRWVELSDHLVGDALLDRVYALGLLGISLASQGLLTDSLTSLDRALALRRQRYEDDADAADFQVIAAQVQIAMGNAAAATALLESAIRIYEKEIARPNSHQEQQRQRLAAIRKRFGEAKLPTAQPK
jgi:tetratricopeptide (TPR) repeat protein